MGNTAALYSELARVVREIKLSSGALSPVHIIVPTQGGSLDVTRYLARALEDRGGLVNVSASTAKELALEIFLNSGAALGQQEVTPLMREAAARTALSRNPGLFGKLATRQATVQAVSRTSSTLDGVNVAQLDSNVVSPLTQEILELHHAIRGSLSDSHYFPDDIFTFAANELKKPEFVKELGKLILFGEIHSEIAIEESFLQHIRSLATLVSAPAESEQGENSFGNPLVTSAELISMTDSDEEARGIARLVAEELASGTPGNRIGIFTAANNPYRALIAMHLDEAGITWSGKAVRQLIDTSVARSLLGLLASETETLDFRLILNSMAERALLPPEKNFPSPAEAEKIYRHLGGQDDDSDDVLTEYAKRQIQRRKQFLDYVDALSAEVSAARNAPTWLEAANRIQELVNTHLTPARKGKSSFTSESDDFETPDVWRTELDLAISQLSLLDSLAPAPSPNMIREQLEAGIKSRFLRHGKMGTGVLVSSLGSGSVRDLDVVIVCGLAEGVAPPRVYENPLLPDALIEQLGSPVPTSLDQVHKLHRQFLETLESSARRRILTYPRGNLRGGGERVLSRWVSSEFETEEEITELQVGSYQEGILTGSPTKSHLATTQQARSMARYRTEPQALNKLKNDSELGTALEMRRDRRSAAFTRFNGNLSHVAEHINVLDHVISPTSIEMYRKTPMSYFLQHVLKASPLNDVVQSPMLDDLTRGTMIHEVLELWILDLMAHEHDGSLDSLLLQAETTFTQYKEQVGAFWIEQFWNISKNHIREDLRDWYQTNSGILAEGWSPVGAEATFPTVDVEAEIQLPGVRIDLLDGSAPLNFLGQIDRYDRREDGSIHVIDYKGGRSSSFEGISAFDPTAGGYKYQLAIYGRLAQLLLKEEHSTETVKASYWFVRRDSESFVSVEMSDDVVERLQTDLTQLAHDIRAGAFPPIPGSPFDDYTALLNFEDMTRLWSDIAYSPELRELTDFWGSESVVSEVGE